MRYIAPMAELGMIVPSLPPARGGLADYAAGLVRRLGRECACFVARGAYESAALGFDARVLGADLPSIEGALESWGGRTLALQYVGYGFERHGAPTQLATALERWRHARGDRRLIVFFHELWASGPPWSRAFWTHRGQVKVAARLGQLADFAFVTSAAARRLLREHGGGDARVRPIPSNVDPTARRAPPGDDGPLELLVFGLRPTRMQALRAFREPLRALARAGRIGHLSLAGGGLQADDLDSPEGRLVRLFLGDVPLRVLGELDDYDASKAITRADLCLSPTPAHLVTKSGASMAALAHGTALALADGTEASALVLGREALVASYAPSVWASLDRRILAMIGAAGRAWYEREAAWPIQLAAWNEALDR